MDFLEFILFFEYIDYLILLDPSSRVLFLAQSSYQPGMSTSFPATDQIWLCEFSLYAKLKFSLKGFGQGEIRDS